MNHFDANISPLPESGLSRIVGDRHVPNPFKPFVPDEIVRYIETYTTKSGKTLEVVMRVRPSTKCKGIELWLDCKYSWACVAIGLLQGDQSVIVAVAKEFRRQGIGSYVLRRRAELFEHKPPRTLTPLGAALANSMGPDFW